MRIRLRGEKAMAGHMASAVLALLLGLAPVATLAQPAPPHVTAQQIERLDAGIAAAGQGDHEQALAIWQQLADEGVPRAFFNIAQAHEMGHGVPKNIGEAVRWYDLAIKRGDDAAHYSMGLVHFSGAMGRVHYQSALTFWHEAHALGNRDAPVAIGYMYEEGLGVAQDYGMAEHWYEVAANDGHADGQYNLALLYAADNGVGVDAGRSAHWLEMAAGQGDRHAALFLSMLYATGAGVERDWEAAGTWFSVFAQRRPA